MMEDIARYYRDWPMEFIHDVHLVGVINTSPDSYFDSSFSSSVEAAVDVARRHIREGADYIEVGGLSGGSAALRVDTATELARTLPVVEAIAAEFPQVNLTVDTFRADVAEAAFDKGATCLNDVTAMTYDNRMVDLARERDAQVFLMHLQPPAGKAGRKLNRPHYADVVEDIKSFFVQRLDELTAAGMRRERIVIDVGLGAGKRPFHDYQLLARLREFSELGVEQMSACSRKQFVEAISPVGPGQRLGGSIVGSLWSVLAGAKYLRVHEVRPYAQMVDVWNGIMSRFTANYPAER